MPLAWGNVVNPKPYAVHYALGKTLSARAEQACRIGGMSDDQQATIAERDAAAQALADAARQRMRRMMLIADALEQSSAEDVRAEAAREIRQLCEWIAND